MTRGSADGCDKYSSREGQEAREEGRLRSASSRPDMDMEPAAPGSEAGRQLARVAPRLLLGPARAAADAELLERERVTFCVNVTRQQPSPRAPGVRTMRVPIFDDPAEDLLTHLEPCCAALEAAARAGGTCLVYCKNGRSRSAAVCTAYLMRHCGLSLEEAFQVVKKARPVAEPNPGFWSQLQKYEDTLQKRPPETDTPQAAARDCL
ncbi:dual specificity phosphatase 28 [Petaurus breviceps papuanus]|uniref:dual specificity phosphatase 28 n=1 Tax=Petaurus breviceps papuanus TaxID=3040969 RepID=UPI0036D9857A